MTEYWAYRYFEDPNLANEVEDEGFDENDILAQWEADAEGQVEQTVSPEQLAAPDEWEPME